MLTNHDLQMLFKTHQDSLLDDWQTVLRFPSVSAEPAHEQDCRACAEWLTDTLNRIGFSARCIETGSKPLVWAERPGSRPGPTVLIYGHYDVQPVDPLEAWETPPFDPVFRDGRCYARGAQDNKGQLMAALGALSVLIREQASLPAIKLVIEGEEEYCSEGIAAVMQHQPELFAADVLMVQDSFMRALDIPTITMGLRGIVQLTIRLQGASHDLHSGMHGGVAPNAAQGMATLLAALHEPDGRIAIPGFYDAVRLPTAGERQLAEAVRCNDHDYASETGCLPLAGPQDESMAMRRGFLPSLDINGVYSGYQGAGMKTVLPALAYAKLSARLVPDQDPEKSLSAIEQYLREKTPVGFTVEVESRHAVAPGFRLDPESALLAKARRVLGDLGSQVECRWEGASIPIVASLATVSGAEPLLVGFGLEEDCIHAPNESFSIDQFRKGFTYVALMVQALY